MRWPVSCRTLLLCVVLLSVACSGGGGGGDNTVALTAQPLLPFVTAGGELKTFDPLNPSQPAISVDTGVTISDVFFFDRRLLAGGTYTASPHGANDYHRPELVYLKQGKVYRLNLLRSGSHAPVRVSSIDDACRLLRTASDFADIDASRLLVETAGDDGDCAVETTNLMKYVRLDVGAGDAAAWPDGMRELTVNLTGNGSLESVLVEESTPAGRYLVQRDIDLANRQVIAELVADSFFDPAYLAQPTRTQSYLSLHLEGTAGSCLYRYDASSRQLGACLHVFQNSVPSPWLSEADGTHLYFVDGDTVFRIGHAEMSATALTAMPELDFLELRLSADRVVLNALDHATTFEYSVFTIPRTPPDGTIVPGLYYSSPNYISLDGVAGSWIYFTIYNGAQFALRGSETGEIAGWENAGWGGFSLSPERVDFGGGSFANYQHTVLGVAGPAYDVAISSVDAQTGEELQPMGTIPFAQGSSGFHVGRYRLSEVTIYRGGGGIDTDIWFSDTLTPGSLIPVAQTVGADDHVAF